jgi:type IV pilus assembly protein PilM
MLFKNSGPTIGIDFSNSGIKIVEVDTKSKPVKVINYVVDTYSIEDRAELSDYIKNILGEKGFSYKKAHIAFSGSLVQHKIITLPQMSKREMKVVLKREAKKEASSIPGEIVCDSTILGTVKEKGIQKNKVQLVIVPRNEVEDTLSFWKGAGVEPQLLTSTPLALLDSLKALSTGWEENIIAFVNFGMLKTFIMIAEQGNLEFSRDFSLGAKEDKIPDFKDGDETPPFDGLESDYIDRIFTEINRSLLYYKHQFRGKSVNKIILGGELTQLEIIKDSLKERFEQDIDIFSPTEYLDTTSLGEHQKAFRKLLPSLATSLGLCLKDIGKAKKINLMPREIVEQKQLFGRKVAMGISSAILLLSLLTGYFFLSQSVRAQQKSLFTQQVFWQEMAPMVNNLTRVERERSLYQSRSLILDSFLYSWTLWHDILKGLSLVVPNEMLFHLVEVTKKGQGYQMDIKGEVIAESAASAQATFNRFYFDLERSPFLKDLDPPVITLNPYVETLQGDSDRSSLNLRLGGEKENRSVKQSVSKLNFEISGVCRQIKSTR